MLKKLLLSVFQKKYVKNYFKSKYKERVLLCYVLKPYVTNNARILQMHQNRRSSLLVGRIFHEMGYAVDVINHDTPEYVKVFRNSSYKYIFGMGASFYSAVKNLRHEKVIYYATGLPTKMHNRLEKERIEVTSKKWKHGFEVSRYINEKYESYPDIDYIIALGNKNQKLNYEEYFKGKFYLLNDLLIKEENKVLPKNWDEAKRNFLFIGSKGKVLSGLDLLLEYFDKNRELNLHIIGGYENEKDFEEFFYDYLYNRENIKTYGWVDVGSVQFDEIVKKCASCIMPVAAAGQNGSILTAMAYGLFPIMSRNCNVDSPFGSILIDTLDLRGVENSISKFLEIKPSKLKESSAKIRRYTLEEHSEKKHKDSMEKILKAIDEEKE